MATSEERTLIETQGTELLGIKDMIEGGTFRSSQYVDLISQSYPPQEQEVVSDVGKEERQSSPEKPERSSPMPAVVEPVPPPVEPATSKLEAEIVPEPEVSSPEVDAGSAPASSSTGPDQSTQMHDGTSESYGPARRSRILAKNSPLTMFRPAAMKHDDFVEVIREVVPQLIDQTMTLETASGSERKREVSESVEAPTPKLPKVDTPADCVEHATACVESAKCSASESASESCSLWNDFRNNQD